MPYKENKNLKLYYSISEVADMFHVSETLLRYWEREFPTFITPRKSGRQIRQYTEENIEQVRLVYHLVKEKGMTLQGARQTLKNNNGGHQPPESHPRRTDGDEAGAGPDNLLTCPGTCL